ncbi:MAG TPA: peptidoglycan-binding domain-containing protein, partial [Terriglobales bacterium]|nr:peptidoglycan-binding domain-containing protein [Terriglobales bacterium]
MRVLLGPGAIGETVRQVQMVLGSNGFNFHICDGWYGPATAECVKAYQRAKALPETGAIDDEGTWQLLMKCPIPTVSERCLQLTAAFEGHGF